jgi:hypothetical protein
MAKNEQTGRAEAPRSTIEKLLLISLSYKCYRPPPQID